MGFWQRLIGGGPLARKDPQDLLPELLASYAEEARLARQIHAHADQAPHQAGAQRLRAVAEEQDRVVRLLGDKIAVLGGTGRDNTGTLETGKNHWTRVVQDIEENHALERHYNKQMAYWDPDLPDAAELFHALDQEKIRINALLRDIALRADPHALD
ncbi:MAG: hypothetical protein HYZ72_18165 [Deltaproteobacteria bacterium]|nr:hypothetical protein [Deltaproteobacteria bacterium]